VTVRVLVVCPRFAPINAADSHRVRLLLPYLTANGCDVEILAVEPTDVPGPRDPWLTERLPPSVPVHRVRAWPLSGRGLNGLAQRSLVALCRKGGELLAKGRFDLVFFSTTEFLVHGLGPLWRRRWGVPFCMDYQDPWVNDYYRLNPQVVPPGGRFKFAVMHRIHERVERAVVRRCSGFLSVSPDYLAALDQRYGGAVAQQPRLVAAFPAEPDEMAGLLPQPKGAENKQRATWRYIGRGGPDMSCAASAFFRAWSRAIESGLLSRDAVRFEAVGTSYAVDGQGEKTLQPLADLAGLANVVTENPERLGYEDTLRALLGSDALVVFGSDDPSYTASKIYPYLLAGKPLLAIFHERSSVVQLIRAVGGAVCVTFNEYMTAEQLADAIGQAWFEGRQYLRTLPLNSLAFEPYTAATQAREVVEWFGRIRARVA
jgi:hypothetical protein